MYMTNGERHLWIGVEFHLRKDGTAIMEIPGQYLRDLTLLLKPLELGTGNIPLSEALCTVGQAGRVSQVIKEARPFTGALYAAYTAAVLSDKEGSTSGPHPSCSMFQVCHSCKVVAAADFWQRIRYIPTETGCISST